MYMYFNCDSLQVPWTCELNRHSFWGTYLGYWVRWIHSSGNSHVLCSFAMTYMCNASALSTYLSTGVCLLCTCVSCVWVDLSKIFLTLRLTVPRCVSAWVERTTVSDQIPVVLTTVNFAMLHTVYYTILLETIKYHRGFKWRGTWWATWCLQGEINS